jgi:plastocyanin
MRVFRLFGLASATALVGGAMWAASAAGVGAYTPQVTMIDNDAPAPSRGFDLGQGYWGYGPEHIVVRKGEQVQFVNPDSNRYPHTVTSIKNGEGGAFAGTVDVGKDFDSSPSREALVQKGTSWTLDTSTLNPGNYAYYCRIHPWMVAKITVTE